MFYEKSISKKVHLNKKSKRLPLEKYGIYLLIFYIISLFVFVDNVKLVNISRLAFILMFIIAFIQIMIKKKIYLGFHSTWLLAFFAFSCMSFFWSLDQSEVIRKIILLSQVITLFFITTQILHFHKQVEKVIFGIGISGIILFLYGMMIYGFQDLFFSIISGERLGGEISQENTMGRLATLSSIVLVAYGMERKKIIYYVLALMPMIMILASGSRTAIVIFLLGILIMIIAKFSFRKMYKFIMVVPLLGILLYFVSQSSIFKPILTRFFGLKSALAGQGGDGTIRINMIKWGWEWFLENPFIGYGLGNYGELLFNKIGMQTYAHNNFIELLVGVGLIGFIFYYAIYVYIFYNLYILVKQEANQAYILFALFFTWFSAEVGAVNYNDKITYVLFGICIAYIRIQKRKTSEIKELNNEYFQYP